jgi:hypothetical protein
MEAVLLAVTLMSLAIAVGASVLAFQVMRAERLRSEARIAALAADLGADDERPIRTEQPANVVPIVDRGVPIVDEVPATPQGMFAVRQRGRSASRVLAGVSVAATIVALVIGSLVMTSARKTAARFPRAASPAASTTTPATPAEVPLELIALGHEREADRLTVRGVVRGTPSAGKGPLTAVVLLFNRQGNEIGSGRTEVPPAGPDPASERTFVVTVPSAGDVGRYRISFRSDDHVVPHVDRRTQPGTAASGVLNVAKSQL